ncbi:MAG TPA: PTS sugar transporter subunit IIA, partial [Candidatus Hydrogenedentes bacterium]|nr:PTS sugar transporter subunit IIA [Candidatus Hydrogenedentota bacterium]
ALKWICQPSGGKETLGSRQALSAWPSHIPQARVAGVGDSMVATGFSETGVDFDAPDGMPANLIFLIITPETDPASQLELGADIARSFRNPSMLERALRTSSYTEFLALLKSASGEE